MAVLECIRNGESLTLNDLHAHTKLSRATLLRALKTLETAGWIQSGYEDGAYGPGPKMFTAPRKRSNRRLFTDLAVRILNELGKEVVWPSDVGVCRGQSMMILESSRGNSPFVINRKAIGRRPRLLKSAMGRVYLAYCPQDERERLLERLRSSTHPDDRIASMRSLVARILRDTRERGYGVREPGYWAEADDDGAEVSSIAVPVMVGPSVLACISLLWVTGASTVEDFANANLKALQSAAENFARSLQERHDGANTADLPDLKNR